VATFYKGMTMRKAYRNGDELAGIGNCDSCEVLVINGMLCHETGCPNAWRDTMLECVECGALFRPETRHQKYCSDSCWAAYNGYPDPDADDTDEDVE